MKIDVHTKWGDFQTAVCIEYNAAYEAEFLQAMEFASLFAQKRERDAKKEAPENGDIND